MSVWIDKRGRRHIGVMAQGRRIHRVLPEGASASDAKRVEAEIRGSLARKDPIIPGDPPLSAVMSGYLEHAKSLKSPATATYHALRCGPWVEDRKASEARQVAAAIIADMRGHYAPGTINRTLGALSKALKLAFDHGMTPTDYSGHVKRVKDRPPRDTVLSIEDVKMIAQAASEQVRAAVWIALYTGCRRGEIVGIREADIGADTITLRAGNTKSDRIRTIPIIAPLRPWLASLPLSINAEGLKTGFRRARESAGMPNVTFHDLRRSCATMMVQAGVDLYVVSKLLGHSSVAVTQQRYAHLQIKAVADGLAKTFAPEITPDKKKARRKRA